MSDPRRRIPSVDELLGTPALRAAVQDWGRPRVTAALRAVLSRLRAELEGQGAPPAGFEEAGWYAEQVTARLRVESRSSLGRVINATGVVLHTNLGRAPLGEAARRALEAAAGYAALELDLESGGRGSRHDHCVGLLRELTGAEDALVVNNNAAAVVLAVNTLAADREVVVSRGELVEIGGSFRVGEILERSGARAREVGATNRTHRRDYEAALGPGTGLILKVHRSNFRVQGFTAEVEPAVLAEVARAAAVPLVHDLGSGLLLDLGAVGLAGEPTARDALEAGADLVTMSGDKLLGGPQAGIVLGRAALIDRLRGNPLMRALRPDKLILAALEATLALYRDPEQAREDVPVLRMLAAAPETLRERAAGLVSALRGAGVEAELADAVSAVGGGALPGVELPATAVAVAAGAAGPDAAARALRLGDPAVVARIRDGRLFLDPRTVMPEEEAELVAAVARAVLPGVASGDGA